MSTLAIAVVLFALLIVLLAGGLWIAMAMAVGGVVRAALLHFAARRR